MFGAWVRSDSGFDQDKTCFTDEPVENTRSEIVLSVVLCRNAPSQPFNWYHNAWCGIDYPENGQVNDQDLPGFACYSQSIALNQLADASSVEQALQHWCLAASQQLGHAITLVAR